MSIKSLSKKICSAAITTALGFAGLSLNAQVYAQSVQGSQMLSAGVASVLSTPVLSLQGRPVEASQAFGVGGAFIVVGIVAGTAEVIKVTLQTVGTGSQHVVEASALVARQASLAVGQSVQVVQQGAGYSLVASGQILAFIPNALGTVLLHQSEVK